MLNYITIRRLAACFLALAMLGSVWVTPSLADSPQYDPTTDFYRDGMDEGVMGEYVKWGTLESLAQKAGEQNSGLLENPNQTKTLIPLFDKEPGEIEFNIQAVESGSWFYPRSWGESGPITYPNNVRSNSCGGGDDAWADYYYVNENYLWNNKIRVWADVFTSWAHIEANGGLDGGYYCVGGYCTISVCTTQEPGANPWSVFLRFAIW